MDYHLLFNRDSYSKQTISKFDILGSYFVHTFYNVLHKRAKNQWLKDTSGETLAHYYTELMDNFIRVITASNSTQSFCKQTMRHLHEYYVEKTRNKTYTYGEFLHEMIKEFFPEDVVNSLRTQQKQHLFEECVINALIAFKCKIQEKYVKIAIDNHDNLENTRLWQDIFIDNLILQREQMRGKIAKGSSNQHIPKYIVDKISRERDFLLDKYNTLKKTSLERKNVYENKINDLIQTCTTLKEYFMKIHKHAADTDIVVKTQLQQLTRFQDDEIELKRAIEQLTLQNNKYLRQIDEHANNVTNLNKEIIQLQNKSMDIVSGTSIINEKSMELTSPNVNQLPKPGPLDMMGDILLQTIKQQSNTSEEAPFLNISFQDNAVMDTSSLI